MAGEMNQLSQTPLGQAIREGNPHAVQQLIRGGEDVNLKDRKGNNYIHYICTINRPHVFHVLIAAGLDPNQQNKHGNTALHVCALQRESCNVPDLMIADTDPSLKNKDGKTAKDLAKDHRLWVDLIQKYEPGLRNAIVAHDIKRIKYLLNCWCAVDLVRNGKDVRQFAAGLTFHDIVAIIDAYKFHLMAVHSILRVNHKSLAYALSRGPECDVNFLHLPEGSHPHHMLQHAINLEDFKMVGMLIEAGADVNTRVHGKEYVYGPLFFEVINRKPHNVEQYKKIVLKIVQANADLNAKDERGRSALLLAADLAYDMTKVQSQTVLQNIIEFFLEKGTDLSLRDDTGCTARDVASLARNHDIVAAIDRYLVNLIVKSDMENLQKLAINGYDHFIVENNYRDSWVYAAGNETPEAEELLHELKTYKGKVEEIHKASKVGDISTIGRIFEEYYPEKELVLQCKDRSGRGSLLIAILYECHDLVTFILDRDSDLAIHDRDNCCRSPLHYAYALEDKGREIVDMLKKCGATDADVDVRGRHPSDMTFEFINTERKRDVNYGMELELLCLNKYEQIMKVIKNRASKISDFEKILKNLRYPVSNFYSLFHPDGNPLVANYRDPLLCAIDNKREYIAKRLVHLGMDCYLPEKYVMRDGKEVMMNALERAEYMNDTKMVEFIKAKAKIHPVPSKMTCLNLNNRWLTIRYSW